MAIKRKLQKQPEALSEIVIETSTTIDEVVKEDCPILPLMLNQIKMELESSQLYMSFAVLCERYGYVNTAKFFMNQSEEERSHAIKFVNEITKLGKTFDMPTALNIEVPQISKVGELLNAAMEHERMISCSINKIYCAAMEAKAGLYLPFLGFMLAEQVEEEQLYRSILRWFKLCDSAVDFELEILKFRTTCDHKIGTLPA